jgi:amidohydrolase
MLEPAQFNYGIIFTNLGGRKMNNWDATRSAILNRIDDLADELVTVSRSIHAHPELAFEEHHAAGLLSDTLEDHGLSVKRGVYTLDTAFETQLATRGDGPNAAILAEYDALPGIGHACGHNLIATAALGATLGLQAVASELPGTLTLLGTPAEERGGGKELMARAGAFDTVSAAMMIHPAGVNLTSMPCICVAEVEVIYHGRSAHASAMPHRGINALDGLLLAYQAISNLRQHIRDNERIHGIVTEGGQAPNIVPDRAVGNFYVRAADEKKLAALKPRVQACFEAGAKGSGAEVEVRWANVDYLDLNTNWPLAECFEKHGESIGREFLHPDALGGAGSTDMGNVSYRVPSIHPMLASAPANVVIHHPDFAQWAGSEMGDAAALDGAKILALTAAEYLRSKDLQQQVEQSFSVSAGLS